MLIDEKELFDMKVSKSNFSYIAKRRQYYAQLIQTLDAANQKMQEVLAQANQLL